MTEITEKVLDTFEDLSGWKTITSGQATLRISQDQGFADIAMRLDFDFRGGGGFVVAAKRFSLEIPASYSFLFKIRGLAPQNAFEFKLVDESHQNVWRYRVEAFDFPETWQPLTIRGHQIGFAWGPLGGGPPRDVTAIELVIAAGPGGKGTVWIETLKIRDETSRLTPSVQASSALPGHGPENALSAGNSNWRSEASHTPQWLLIDFRQVREYGGLVVQWEKGYAAQAFDVQVSFDGGTWNTVYATSQGGSERSYLYLPQSTSRCIRINLLQSENAKGFAIRRFEVKPYDFSRTLNHFFESIAREEPAGLYPKYFLGRQTYWTVVGTGDGEPQALMNEEGMVEVDKGSFSIEPFFHVAGRLFNWADGDSSQALATGYLPIPSSEWRIEDLTMKVTAFTVLAEWGPVLFIRYRLTNISQADQSVLFFAALRPFQVTPTWQNWQSFGGVSRVQNLAFRDGMVRINDNKVVIPLSSPVDFGGASFAAGGATRYLAMGELPPQTQVTDDFGFASGALRFDLNLGPGLHEDVYLAVPFGTNERMKEGAARTMLLGRSLTGHEAYEQAARDWEAKFKDVKFHLPSSAQPMADTFKTAAAHILINRDGPALCPGPRRYTRSWIRDGAIMGAALLRMGHPGAIREFIHWYAGFQEDDGNIPDSTGREGPEWLPEFDAYGEFIFAIMEYFRFTGDKSFLVEMWPAAVKALAFMEGLRLKRLTPEYQTQEKRAYYGLLPESMSHEGYMAHPVHAYWDDFWAIRGLGDAAQMAEVLGDDTEAGRLTRLKHAFSEDVRASLAATIARHGIDFIPGSVEHGDFDPTATAIAVALLDELSLLPRAETDNTFDKYLAGFRERKSGSVVWNNYSAYEIRIIGALVRLGKRAEAMELLEFMLADRRILPWNQWPEISWRDPSSPSFMGDLPHTWISGEYILALRSLFVYEIEADKTLVIAGGVAQEWLTEGHEVGVENLPTYYGKISYSLRLEEPNTLRLKLKGDLIVPAGGILVKPPLTRPIRQVEVNGRMVRDFDMEGFICRECPAEGVVRF
ncbi:MAG: discoidin domain-containing protein [Desulfobacterales bacterium]